MQSDGFDDNWCIVVYPTRPYEENKIEIHIIACEMAVWNMSD